MPTNPSSKSRREASVIAEEATLWLARRDRGLTPAEQDAYMQWISSDPRHSDAVAQHAAAFERLMQLYDWQPGQSANINPDLFAPAQNRPWHRWGLSLAAAAVVAVAAALLWREAVRTVSPSVTKSYLRVNERQALPDGSVVELKDGSRILVEFTATERRVLLTGEAHFKVAKNPTPFVVMAGGVALRAVGTAFNARLGVDAVEVLVTEGVVSVARATEPGLAHSRESAIGDPLPNGHAPLVVAGQRGVVPLATDATPSVNDVSPAEVQRLLEWQAPRLQFFETPLFVAVAEFNRHNHTRLLLADRELGAVRIGGTFRADNPDGFVRVLELTLELKAVRRDTDEILLTRSR